VLEEFGRLDRYKQIALSQHMNGPVKVVPSGWSKRQLSVVQGVIVMSMMPKTTVLPRKSLSIEHPDCLFWNAFGFGFPYKLDGIKHGHLHNPRRVQIPSDRM
jgi:hypothetical protein